MDERAAEELPDLNEWVAEEWPRLHAYVRAKLGAELRAWESASDVVQSVWCQLVRSKEPLAWRGKDRLRYWLFVTARNKVRQHLRRHRIRCRHVVPANDEALLHGAPTPPTFAPDASLQCAEALARFVTALDALPDEYSELIELHCVAGVPYETIAEARGCSVQAVRTKTCRAKAKLAKLLSP